ncbi:hypothetical protein M569_03640 [Genlisea aurea]|uniref:Glycosyltransferase 61 catalytic domain-containing protein n=1 Tax=Genlisea aurea TaxID=192259 RepID=S8D1A4_9LAMI|nr:hypothetical protein M569_03640 [Genlisea aurea]
MDRESRKVSFFRITPWLILFVFTTVYIVVSWKITIRLQPRKVVYYSSASSSSSSSFLFVFLVMSESADFHEAFAREVVFSGEDSGRRRAFSYDRPPLGFLLSKLLEGNDRKKLLETGFSCDGSGISSKHCVVDRDMRIDTTTMTVTVASTAEETVVVRPYARQEDKPLLQRVSPVKIIAGKSLPASPCQHNHRIPAVVFSTSGFVGNVFHEINEIIIPLYITAKLFETKVQLIAEDYNPRFMKKYSMAFKSLASSEIINPETNRSTHCFPGGVVGLKFHGHLAVNSGDVPTGLSTADFRQFLRDSFNLKYTHVSQIKRPRLLLLSRRATRRFLNEDEMVRTMRELGFEVITISRAKTVSNIASFSRIINSCTVFVAAHGAGLTNELFLPDGAVVVQVDLIGLSWAAAAYYGNPGRAMGLHYLRYQIMPHESSLWKVFGPENSRVFTDPNGTFPTEAGREIYLNGQNVRVDIDRFRETMVEAMSFVRGEDLTT